MPDSQQDMVDHYIRTWLLKDHTESAVVVNGKMVVNAMKGDHGEYEMPYTPTTSNRRSTLNRGMRVNNRSLKHRKQWHTSQQERSVLRYTTG